MAETSSRSGKGLGIASVLLGLVLLATGLFLQLAAANWLHLVAAGTF